MKQRSGLTVKTLGWRRSDCSSPEAHLCGLPPHFLTPGSGNAAPASIPAHRRNRRIQVAPAAGDQTVPAGITWLMERVTGVAVTSSTLLILLINLSLERLCNIYRWNCEVRSFIWCQKLRQISTQIYIKTFFTSSSGHVIPLHLRISKLYLITTI